MEPGCTLSELELSFHGRGTPEEWRRYVNEGRFDLDPTTGDGDVAAFFAALPTEIGAGAKYITGGFHSTGSAQREHGDVHWHLKQWLCPNEEPPPALVEASNRLGGVEGLLSTLQRLWPGPSEVPVKIRGRFDVTGGQICVPGGVWRPEPVTKPCDGVDRKLKPSTFAVSWTIEPPVGGVTDAWFVVSDGEVVLVTVSGTLTLEISSRMLSLAEEQLWRSLSIFKRT